MTYKQKIPNEIQVGYSRFETQSPCFDSQELNYSTTAAP